MMSQLHCSFSVCSSQDTVGKSVRIKAKTLSTFFWNRQDVVSRYHLYESGDSSSEFEVEESDFDDVDSDEWTLGTMSEVATGRKRKRR